MLVKDLVFKTLNVSQQSKFKRGYWYGLFYLLEQDLKMFQSLSVTIIYHISSYYFYSFAQSVSWLVIYNMIIERSFIFILENNTKLLSAEVQVTELQNELKALKGTGESPTSQSFLGPNNRVNDVIKKNEVFSFVYYIFVIFILVCKSVIKFFFK